MEVVAVAACYGDECHMAKKMLIDATHAEESRVAVIDGNRLEDYEVETSTKQQFKGNIYLAKVIRIEPSLQAAFVEYGQNRHGFLPFAEIHPDYYRIPVGDRPLVESAEKSPDSLEDETVSLTETLPEVTDAAPTTELVVDDSSDDEESIVARRPKPYHYKIQEVIKRRQIMLIQVVKEERGNKGAALTTYLSMPGRYCVLMPNAGHRSGGISRKITDVTTRKRLRDILNDLPIPDGMSLIVRTAGQDRNKLEIRRDFEYLIRLWSDIREKTLSSMAPALIYAEGDIIKRSIRDNYGKDIDEIWVDGDEGYKAARAMMKTLTPSHVKRVKQHKGEISLFQKHGVDIHVDAIMSPVASLPSGGSIVINPTEALVAIDVNSGKATRERHIDETALKTNLEAADEVARQIKLRDLGGLVVIDFIDMADQKHIQQVEKRLRDAVKNDRARIQLGRISQFGLMELSRQRLRPSIIETNMKPCPHCHGTGMIRSIESMVLFVLRGIEAVGLAGKSSAIMVTVPADIDLYLLNQKRSNVLAIEQRYQMSIMIQRDANLIAPDFNINTLVAKAKVQKQLIEDRVIEEDVEEIQLSASEEESTEQTTPRQERGRNRRHPFQRRRNASTTRREDQEGTFVEEEGAESQEALMSAEDSGEPKSSRTRRRRRRGRKPESTTEAVALEGASVAAEIKETAEVTMEPSETTKSSERPNRNRRRRNRRPMARSVAEGGDTEAKGEATKAVTTDKIREHTTTPTSPEAEAVSADGKKRRRGFWRRLLDT
ncbi:Rne/Rng family ribonuclease [Candidatus Odyssella acanthamoebae]|uniref:Rne/Rng family ribonuclease n=1 Tax=Candidatus Odyssella acanthamoebae TaxID=91604 RepID=UPI000B1F4274|nr:ribonuclease E/G [Candidatus Paracaedibacter acanthamoebae]